MDRLPETHRRIRWILPWLERLYKIGFGDPAGEYWLGNDKIHRMTRQGTNKLRVDLEDTTGDMAYAEYSSFNVSNESDEYRLSLGTYSG